MKIICKKTSAEGFKSTNSLRMQLENYDYGGYYGIELNKEYLVMGIITYQKSNCIYYLIDVCGLPV